jgi:nuclear transport factor 2 (NTF2) superfamily protein
VLRSPVVTKATLDDLAAIFRDAGAAHHRAFASSNGHDPDWCGWYANYLAPRLQRTLGGSFDVSALAGELRRLDAVHRAAKDPAPWPEFYASCLLVRAMAARYTAAWCSQNPASVAAFFAEGGSLTINAGPPSVGRAALTEAAREFMTTFPDMVVAMDALDIIDDRHAVFRWTLTGTNSGPGGNGNAVRISGHEEWALDEDGLIARSLGHFDAADYQRQLGGV